jgi:hypothetical protein
VPRPPRSATSRPVLAALAALLVAALSATGCVSMPSGGAVRSYPVTQGTDAQNQPYVQIQPQPPGVGWSPQEIVEGFLTASANFGSYPQVAKEYLTQAEAKTWDPSWSAVVYKSGPNVTAPAYPSTAKKSTTASVGIAGKIQARLQGNGKYSVPSGRSSATSVPPFQLVKGADGQWRISYAPSELLLTSNSFANDYQLSNLYFFDPLGRFLVPDPVYVPQRGDLMDGLVNDLIVPPDDWLSGGATKTVFPPKTKVNDVVLDGVTAVVDLTGTAIGKASTDTNTDVMQRISAQLLSTLSDATPSGSTGQGVQSVEVVVNGKPWVPPDSQGNPVQPAANWHPALGTSTEFYYVNSAGNLIGRTATGNKTVTIAKIGTGYSKIAISADGAYLAALRGSTLYTGLVDGPLTKRGSGFMTMSWDPNDNLWASQGAQVVMFRGTQNPRQPLGPLVPVEVQPSEPFTSSGPYTALQVAPDGVRVAMVIGGSELTFGAISRQQSQNPQITLSLVQEDASTQAQTAPANASFTSLTWYGPDKVITLGEPGPSVTEYPVSGGSPTSIQADPDMQTITASSPGQPLIAGLPKGRMKTDASPIGSWMFITDGDTPADGSFPAYPG